MEISHIIFHFKYYVSRSQVQDFCISRQWKIVFFIPFGPGISFFVLLLKTVFPIEVFISKVSFTNDAQDRGQLGIIFLSSKMHLFKNLWIPFLQTPFHFRFF